jgi:tetratricopeptide (TPR) repeat protein
MDFQPQKNAGEGSELMRLLQSTWGGAALSIWVAITTALLIANAHAQGSRLGSVQFPTSAQSQEAQAHFVRGVAALHSFWYPVALEEFRAASRIEPDFAMAYWGEALAHNHPVWGDPQDTAAARAVLAKLPAAPAPSPREQVYLDAVRALYGEGEKPERDRAYAAAMDAVHRTYPDDLEAAAFYSLALLGVAYGGGSDAGAPEDPAALRTRMPAAAVAQEVLRREPNHPGAAHYILHAFDDPDHAVLGLPAARRYAKIAPAAPHALHMPSHIFLQLGMWPEAAASNEASWQASTDVGMPDFHSLHWLLYTYLQQGRSEEAKALLAIIRERLAKGPKQDMRNQVYGAYIQATMAATFLVETEQWDETSKLLGPEATEGVPQTGTGGPYQAFAALAQTPAVFARGLATALTGSGEVQEAVATLQDVSRQVADAPIPFAASMAPVLEIQALEIEAAASASRGQIDEAIATMRQATTREEAMPVAPGPPALIKPSHELLGEILLQAGRHEEAARAFATSLFRHPGRAQSVAGAAQAAQE